MKKIIKKLIFSIVILFLSFQIAKSDDNILEVSLENYIYDGSKGIAQFDLYVSRLSDIWHLWENATLQFEFFDVNSLPINYEDYNIEVDVAQSDIITIYTGVPAYKVKSNMIIDKETPSRNRLMIVVVGPVSSIDAKHFIDRTKLKLFTVRLTSKSADIPLPVVVDWKQPYEYYQAAAYKYVKGINSLPDDVIVANDEDNIDIGWLTKYLTNIKPNPKTFVDFFHVDYLGNLNAVCRYATKSEYNNAGFVIKRGIVTRLYSTEEYEDLPDSIFKETIGDYRKPEFADLMSGQVNSHYGKIYPAIHHKVEHRMVNYVYRLYSNLRGTDSLVKIATRNLLTPNAVITLASAYPNPCSGKSSVEYVVDDDVYLTCEVYDQLGRKVRNLADNINGLLDNTYVKMGKYVVKFETADLSSQGMYDVMFTAYPINDKSVEISKANVKIQLIRGMTIEDDKNNQ